jgi:hypothetical protein
MRVVHDPDFDPGEDMLDGDEEILDGELVGGLAERPSARAPAAEEPRALTPEDRPGQGLDWVRAPAVQNAVAAATGFVAGAATLALMRRYGRAKLERVLASSADEPLLPPGAPLGPGRTYLVHVRPLPTIGPPGTSGE